MNTTLTKPDNALSTQERKILLLIAKGYKSHDIAEALFISPHTVKNHKTKICQKLNLKSTVELLKYSFENVTTL